jgi:hypothetical protein
MTQALRFTIEFTVENSQKVIYVLWHTHEFRLSLANGDDQEHLLSSTKSIELGYTILRIVIA